MTAPRRGLRADPLVGLAALLLTSALLWLAAAPAMAHDSLTSSRPQNAQQVTRVPASVVLTFDEPALAMGTQVVVTGPRGPVQQGPPVLVDKTVTQAVRGDAPAGSYTVDWRVTSADGHPVSGSFTFSARAGGAGQAPAADAPAGPAATGQSRSSAPWVWLVVGLVAAGTALSVVGSRHRRRRAAAAAARQTS